MGVKVGDTMSGMHLESNGFLSITKFMYLALGAPGKPGKTPASYDAAVPSWVLVSCRGMAPESNGCDFSKVPVAVAKASALLATV